jgi:hypothetical protein
VPGSGFAPQVLAHPAAERDEAKIAEWRTGRRLPRPGPCPRRCARRDRAETGGRRLAGLIQRLAPDEVFQFPLTPHGEVPLSPVTGPGERRAHYAAGTAITVSYLAARDTGRERRALTGVITLAVPFPPPGRAVAVLFPGIDGMAQAVIDAGLDGVAPDDSSPGKTGSAGRASRSRMILNGTTRAPGHGRRTLTGLRCEYG